MYSALTGNQWAILPETLATIGDLVRMRMTGVELTAAEIEARIGTRRKLKPITGRIAVLPLQGVLVPKMSMMLAMIGGTSTDQFGQWFDRAVADSEVGAIVLDVDSPGGSVYGLPELSAKIFGARGAKPIVAVANHMAASAAYYVATAADQLVVSPSGTAGSVGTVWLHTDRSKADEMEGFTETLIFAGKHKTEGNPFEPLSDEARENMQQRVDEYYAQFVGDLARNRGTSPGIVRSSFGQGRMFGADELVRRGMADRVGTLEGVLQELGAKVGSTGRAGAHHSVDLRRRRAAMRARRQNLRDAPGQGSRPKSKPDRSRASCHWTVEILRRRAALRDSLRPRRAIDV